MVGSAALSKMLDQVILRGLSNQNDSVKCQLKCFCGSVKCHSLPRQEPRAGGGRTCKAVPVAARVPCHAGGVCHHGSCSEARNRNGVCPRWLLDVLAGTNSSLPAEHTGSGACVVLAESCPGSTQPGCVGLSNSPDSAAASSSFLLLHVPVTSVIEALLPQLGKLTLVTVFAGATPRRGPGCASLELTPERRGALRQSHQPVPGSLTAPRDPRTSAHGGMKNKGQRGTTTSPAFVWACTHNLGAEGKLPASAQRHPPGRGLTQTLKHRLLFFFCW